MISIDFSDKRSISEQIVEKFTDLVMRGILPEGSALPSVRSLATELSVNPNTVQRAYSELEQRGVIASVRGRGSIVTQNEQQRRKLCDDGIAANLREATVLAVRAGIGSQELCGRLADIYATELLQNKGGALT